MTLHGEVHGIEYVLPVRSLAEYGSDRDSELGVGYRCLKEYKENK